MEKVRYCWCRGYLEQVGLALQMHHESCVAPLQGWNVKVKMSGH